MKTRRNRGGAGWGLDMFKSVGKTVSNAVGVGNKNELDPSFLAEINKLNAAFSDIDAFKTANPDKLPDLQKEVSDLGSLTGYSEAALINAIVAHNTAYKLRQLDNTLGSECGPKCAERAQSIRVALRKLVEYSERSDALGYIGIGRGVVNNSSYVANSAASGVSKFGDAVSYGANTAASGLSKIGNVLFSSTPKSEPSEPQPGQPQPDQPQPVQPQPGQPPPAQPQTRSSTPSNQQNAVGTSMAGTAGSGFFGLFGGKRTRRRR